MNLTRIRVAGATAALVGAICLTAGTSNGSTTTAATDMSNLFGVNVSAAPTTDSVSVLTQAAADSRGFAYADSGLRPADLQRTRVVANKIGPDYGDLVAVSTSTGSVCYVANDTVSCAASFRSGSPIAWGVGDPDGTGGLPPYVVGIARNDVSAVDVLVSGSWLPTVMGINGFHLELPVDTAARGLAVIGGFRVHFTGSEVPAYLLVSGLGVG